MENKEIHIYTGDKSADLLYEQGLHPINQIKYVKKHLNELTQTKFITYTNSPFVVEAFNSLVKKKNLKYLCIIMTNQMIIKKIKKI